jgi:hypothetical protein
VGGQTRLVGPTTPLRPAHAKGRRGFQGGPSLTMTKPQPWRALYFFWVLLIT